MPETKDISQLTVAQMSQQLTLAYTSVINAKLPLSNIPSVMIWGPPGVGKSQGIRQIATDVSMLTGKRVIVTDVRLLLFNPVDLRGIPTANADKTLAVWLKPKIFQMDESEECINILFLDELSAAPPSVQAAAYQITLDRTVGEHQLPSNCIVIAAGNRVTDRSVAFNMPKALANRLCHIEIVSDIDSWKNWAYRKGINHMVVGYISANPTYLMGFNPENDGLAFPTPRTWEMVSNILNSVTDNPSNIFPLIAGCIGSDIATDFCAWSEIYGKIPTIESVLAGKATTVPTRPEALYALVGDLTLAAHVFKTERAVCNLVTYTAKLAPEFKHILFSDLLKIEDIRPTLKMCKEYCEWFEQTEHYWEDYDL